MEEEVAIHREYSAGYRQQGALQLAWREELPLGLPLYFHVLSDSAEFLTLLHSSCAQVVSRQYPQETVHLTDT